MSGAPKLSVVIPLYNKERYIRRALLSVQRQTASDYEVVIVDDGSTDSSATVVQPWLSDKRFHLVSQQNGGEGTARNRGLREATGSIIAFLDADDEWLPGHIKSLLDLALRFPEASFFATGYRAIYRGQFNALHTLDRDSPCLVHDYYQLACSGRAVHISGSAIRRSLLACGVKFKERERIGADEEFFTCLSINTRLAFDPHVSSVYHCDNQGSVMATANWSSDLPLTARSLIQYVAENKIPPTLRDSALKYLGSIIHQHSLAGIAAGKKTGALDLLDQSKLLSFEDKRKLAYAKVLLDRIPLQLSRLVLRVLGSRWYMIMKAPLMLFESTATDQPKARVRIDWRCFLSHAK